VKSKVDLLVDVYSNKVHAAIIYRPTCVTVLNVAPMSCCVCRASAQRETKRIRSGMTSQTENKTQPTAVTRNSAPFY